MAAVLARPDPGEVLRGTFVPNIQFNREFLSILVAIIGTTLSAYLYTWQSNEEVEEEIALGRTTLEERQGASRRELRETRRDIFWGMAFSNLVMYFIILATASASGMVPGCAPSYPFGITSIMNRIVDLPSQSAVVSPVLGTLQCLPRRLQTNVEWRPSGSTPSGQNFGALAECLVRNDIETRCNPSMTRSSVSPSPFSEARGSVMKDHRPAR